MPDAESREFDPELKKPMPFTRMQELLEACNTAKPSPLLDMLQDAVNNISWWEGMYNRLRDDQAGDFERWFRLVGSPGILTGYQPECATIVNEICIGYQAQTQLLRELIPDQEKREDRLIKAVEQVKDRLRKEQVDGE